MKAELVPVNGDPPIPITKDVTVLGRREFCDVQIDFHGLSKRHCVVVKTDGLLVIRDLATTNGTKVNGQRVRWAALLPNDRLTVGGYKMRVYLGPDDAPGPSEGGAMTPAAKAATPSRTPAPSAARQGRPAPARAASPVPAARPKPAIPASHGADWISPDVLQIEEDEDEVLDALPAEDEAYIDDLD